MSADECLIRNCTLGGGIPAKIVDATSHYFGGYYHVKIRICAEVPVTPASFDSEQECQDAIRRLGRAVRFCRDLEKMAVPEEEIDSVRRHLLDSFDSNVLAYLMRDDFAVSFVRNEYRQALKLTPPRYR